MPMLTTLRMRLPVWPFQSPLRTRSAKSPILSSTAWTSGTTFSPSTTIDAPARRAQRDVQHRAVLGDVDLLAGEHRVDLSRAGSNSSASFEQQLQRLVGDAVLRIVEVDARPPSAVSRSPRSGVFAKRSRRCVVADRGIVRFAARTMRK